METPVTRTLVPEGERFEFLPAKVGPQLFVLFENSVYQTLDRLTEGDYTGGYWEFYELSNGGWYMAPTGVRPYRFMIESNGYEGVLSADASGIVATMFAMNGALHNAPLETKQARYLTNAYYALKDYACEHAEAAGILGAID